jgi:GMP synthase - Glutamine amidotransferase domain
MALIAECARAQKAVLGVCLGSQLIGEALGAKFGHSPEKEIGKFPIMLTEEGLVNRADSTGRCNSLIKLLCGRFVV